MDYFKNRRDDAEIFLITKDKGFLKQNAEILENEFYDVTNRKIKIEESSYYKVLVGEKDLKKQIWLLPTPSFTFVKNVGIRMVSTI